MIWSPRRASGIPEPMDSFVTPRASSSSAPSPGAIDPLLCLRGIGRGSAAPCSRTSISTSYPAKFTCAFMGANGAGKSTLARIISGLVQPDAGSMMQERSSYRPAGKAAAEWLGAGSSAKKLSLDSHSERGREPLPQSLTRGWGWYDTVCFATRPGRRWRPGTG